MADVSISRAWDESKAIIARDGKLLVTLALALIGLPSLISAILAPETESGAERDPLTLLVMLVGGIVAIAGQLAIARMALSPSTTVGGAIRHGFRRLLPQLGALLLMVGGAVLILLPFVLLAQAWGAEFTAEGPRNWSGSLTLLALLLVGVFIYFGVRLMLTTPVAAAEQGGAVMIIKRSWELTRGRFWRLFGFLVAILIAIIIISVAIGAAFGVAIATFLGPIEPMSASALAIGLLQALINAAFTTLFVVMLVRIYAQASGRESIAEETAAA